MNTANRSRVTSSTLTVLMTVVIAATICDEVAAVDEIAEAIQDMYAAIRTSETNLGGGTVRLDCATRAKAKYVRDSLRRMIDGDDNGSGTANRFGHPVSKDLTAVDVQDENNGVKTDDDHGNGGFTGYDGDDVNADAQLDGSIDRLMDKCVAIALAKDKGKSKDTIVDELEHDFLDVVGRRYARLKKPSTSWLSPPPPSPPVAIDIEISTSMATTGRMVGRRRHDQRMSVSSAATATAAAAAAP